MFKKLLIICTILFSAIAGGFASSWELLGGTNGFTAEIGQWVDFDFKSGSTPVVVYSDQTNGFYSTIGFFTNAGNITNSYKNIKSAFSPAVANYMSIAINPSNDYTWIAFSDRYATFKGSLWAYTNAGVPFKVSNSFTSNIGQEFQTKVDLKTNLVIVYEDYQNQNSASALKFNGATFSQLGTPGFSSNYAQDFSPIAVDLNNDYWIAFSEFGRGNEISVYKYTNSTWTRKASTTVPGAMPSLASYNGNTYLAYRNNIDWKIYVTKYTNGAPGFYNFGTNAGVSTARADYPSIDVNSNGIFLAFKDFNVNNGNLAVLQYKFLSYQTNANTNITTYTNTFNDKNAWTNAQTNKEAYTSYIAFTNVNFNTLISNVVTTHLFTNILSEGGAYISNYYSIDGSNGTWARMATNTGTSNTTVFQMTNVMGSITNFIVSVTNPMYVNWVAGNTNVTNSYFAGIGGASNTIVWNAFNATSNVAVFNFISTNVYTNASWFTNTNINLDANIYSWTNTVINTTNGTNQYINSYVNTETNTWSTNFLWSFISNDTLICLWTNAVTNVYTPGTLNTTYNSILFTNAVVMSNQYVWTNTNLTYTTAVNINTNTNIVTTNLIVVDIFTNSVTNPDAYTNSINFGQSIVTTNYYSNRNKWSTVGSQSDLAKIATNFVGKLKLKVTSASNVPYIIFQDMPNQKEKLIRYR